jgi:outer membrane protein assembly factor BamB
VFTILNPGSQDTDFGTNPILFEATIDGRQRKLLAAGQKSGVFWALDRESGEVVWSQAVSPGSALIGGFLNNGAYDGEHILAAGNNGSSSAPGSEEPVPPSTQRSRLVAFDPATGAIVWERQIGGWVWAPLTVANGVGYVAVDTTLQAFDARTGAKLFTFPTNGTITSAPVVADGRVYFGSGLSYFVGTRARDFYALSLEGGGGDHNGGNDGTTFRAIYTDIIVGQGCTTTSCHGSNQGNLRMSSRAEAYANLVSVAASGPLCEGIGLNRVEPGDPDHSLLYDKISQTQPACGTAMPPTGPLSAEDVARIRDWITRGAPDD